MLKEEHFGLNSKYLEAASSIIDRPVQHLILHLPAGKSFVESKKYVIILLVGIMITLNGLFFYFQTLSEQQIRNSLFEQTKDRQIESTRAISQHIGSDLRSIVTSLIVLAQDPRLKDGDLGDDQSRLAAEKTLQEINADREIQGSAPIDRLFIIDNQAQVKYSLDYPAMKPTLNQSAQFSDSENIIRTKETLSAVFSKGYVAADGSFRIAVTYPVLSSSGDYRGIVGVSVSTADFFHHYGNIYDIQSQYLAVLDTDSVQLVHPVQAFVSKPFFSEFIQNQTGRIEGLNNLVRSTLDGDSGFTIYEFRNGERLTTGHPIFIRGVPTYFVFVITPTAGIYSQVDAILASERIQTLILLSSVTGAIGMLIMFLLIWNQNLERSVKQRTAQLEESNKQLSFANERLIKINEQLNDSKKAQEEFVNIAAHELRTPIQPIIGLVEILQGRKDMSDHDQMVLSTINRSAQRLQRLASNILDVTKIESKSLILHKSRFDINETISSATDEYKKQIQEKQIVLFFQPDGEITVNADKERMAQVIHNLLNNAIKFVEGGKITLQTRIEKTQAGSYQVVVSIEDTGPGIDAEIMEKLFTRFTTKAEQGTGLGLFISKNIIEAHGGKIWAENTGKGAVFSFSLPINSLERLEE